MRGNDVEVGVAIPIGCLVPLAAMLAAVISVGVIVGTHIGQASPPDHSVVRVIDDGANGGPAILSTQIVPVR